MRVAASDDTSAPGVANGAVKVAATVPLQSGAPPENADASLRFSGTADRMKVGVARYIPARGNGRSLSIELIQKQLRDAGVKVPLSSKGAEKLLQCIANGEPIDRIVVAKGQQPENGTDAYIVPYGNFNYPAFPGQKIGNKVCARPPKPGMRVDGSEIPPQLPHKPREIIIPDDCNCLFDEASQDVISTIYGLVQVTDKSMQIQPQVMVSSDALEVRGTLYYRDMEGKPISAERFLLMLEVMHVPVELVDVSVIRETLARCERTGTPESDVLLARARAEEDGKDGFVEMIHPEDSAAHVGKTAVGGAIDYKNRGVTPAVQVGEPVARIQPPTSGRHGLDVLGRVLPARDGQAAKVVLDKSVVLAGDGTTVIAQVSGLGAFTGGVLSVQEVVEVMGDVDFASGNIQVGAGAVRVKGAVLSGFSVKTPGSLVVGEVIESARVVVGGNVEVAGGIAMQGKGFVRCGGSVLAKYISEAVIEARDDVVVLDSVLHSTILCGGRVVATSGRGRIQGGSVTCRKGVSVLEVGSDLGVATHITLAASSKALRDLEKERDAVKEALAKISMKFGDGPEEDILMNANPEHYKSVEMALALRGTLTEKLGVLRDQLVEAKREATKKLKDAVVSVSGTVHAGTVITIGEAVFNVTYPLQAAVFRYVPESHTIEVTSAS